MNRLHAGVLATALAGALLPRAAVAHGFAGDRFFPATILTDDPFVADEMSLPTLTRNPTGSDGSQESNVEVDLSKRITPDIDFTLQRQWAYVQPRNATALTGFGALTTGLQYQLFINAPHEAMALVGLDATWGHTGRVQALGPARVTPRCRRPSISARGSATSGSLPYLRPFAITGNLSFDFPTKVESNGVANSDNFNYGFAIEYGLEYLEHHVKDVGIGHPLRSHDTAGRVRAQHAGQSRHGI